MGHRVETRLKRRPKKHAKRRQKRLDQTPSFKPRAKKHFQTPTKNERPRPNPPPDPHCLSWPEERTTGSGPPSSKTRTTSSESMEHLLNRWGSCFRRSLQNWTPASFQPIPRPQPQQRVTEVRAQLETSAKIFNHARTATRVAIWHANMVPLVLLVTSDLVQHISEKRRTRKIFALSSLRAQDSEHKPVHRCHSFGP